MPTEPHPDHDLEPCPFCGATQDDVCGPRVQTEYDGPNRVYCGGCDAYGPYGDNADWNGSRNDDGFSSSVAESSTHERMEELEDALEQACKDLNAAHDKIVELQDEEADVRKHDWPEWSSPANTIRWAEELLDKRLAKTENWTLHLSEASG